MGIEASCVPALMGRTKGFSKEESLNSGMTVSRN